MASAAAKAEEKRHQELRNFLRSVPDNKKCFNCAEKGPQYICTDFKTFVCTVCSGIHREFNHRVKSISLSKWTDEEVSGIIATGGNERARETFLKYYKEIECPRPNPGDKYRIQDFIRSAFVDKKWTEESRSSIEAARESKKEKKNKKGEKDKPVKRDKEKQKATSAADGGWDAFGSQNSKDLDFSNAQNFGDFSGGGGDSEFSAFGKFEDFAAPPVFASEAPSGDLSAFSSDSGNPFDAPPPSFGAGQQPQGPRSTEAVGIGPRSTEAVGFGDFAAPPPPPPSSSHASRHGIRSRPGPSPFDGFDDSSTMGGPSPSFVETHVPGQSLLLDASSGAPVSAPQPQAAADPFADFTSSSTTTGSAMTPSSRFDGHVKTPSSGGAAVNIVANPFEDFTGPPSSTRPIPSSPATASVDMFGFSPPAAPAAPPTAELSTSDPFSDFTAAPSSSSVTSAAAPPHAVPTASPFGDFQASPPPTNKPSEQQPQRSSLTSIDDAFADMVSSTAGPNESLRSSYMGLDHGSSSLSLGSLTGPSSTSAIPPQINMGHSLGSQRSQGSQSIGLGMSPVSAQMPPMGRLGMNQPQLQQSFNSMGSGGTFPQAPSFVSPNMAPASPFGGSMLPQPVPSPLVPAASGISQISSQTTTPYPMPQMTAQLPGAASQGQASRPQAPVTSQQPQQSKDLADPFAQLNIGSELGFRSTGSQGSKASQSSTSRAGVPMNQAQSNGSLQSSTQQQGPMAGGSPFPAAGQHSQFGAFQGSPSIAHTSQHQMTPAQAMYQQHFPLQQQSFPAQQQQQAFAGSMGLTPFSPQQQTAGSISHSQEDWGGFTSADPFDTPASQPLNGSGHQPQPPPGGRTGIDANPFDMW